MNETERRLAEFVDRTTDMERFGDVLGTHDKPVMAVWADGGMGKSSLMARMIHECSLRQLRKVEIAYSKRTKPGYLDVMRKCRDDLGAPRFSAFTELVNYYTVQEYKLTIGIDGNVIVGNNMTIGAGGQVGNITGVVVNVSEDLVRDQMRAQGARTDLNVSSEEQTRRLTDSFLQHLKVVASDGLIVVFIDGAENMLAETEEWLWESLIRGIGDRGITNVRFVILGRKKPEVDRYKKELIVFNELKPLEKPDVIEYLRKRGIPDEDLDATAKTLMAAHKGLPLNIATTVDSLLEDQDDEDDA